MSSLKLFVLGPPRVEFDSVPVELESRKGLALLVYLAVTGESHSRDGLSTLLWPDADQSRGRAYLRHALWSVKKNTGEGMLDISREQIGVRPEAEVWLDVDQFRQRVALTTHHPSPESMSAESLAQLAQAVDLCRGDFLSGFTLPDAPEFDEWQFFQTEELRQKLAGVLERLVTGHHSLAQYEPALVYARRWLALDPLHEPAQQRLMQIYAQAGQPAAALRQYEEYVALLETELGLPPQEETTTLYEAIKANRMLWQFLKSKIDRPAREQKDRMDSPAFVAEDSPEPVQPLSFEPGDEKSSPAFLHPAQDFEPEEIVFVGRRQELTRLNERLTTALAGRFQLLFVLGEAGQGKTALLQAFARQAQKLYPGLVVAGGTCNAYTGIGDPYLPFREILELLAGDIEARATAGTLQQDHNSRLWHLLPLTIQALLERGPDLIDIFLPAQNLLNRAGEYTASHPPWLARLQTFLAQRANRPDHANMQQSALFEQYARVLQTLANQVPLLLMLDDLQWADPGSASLLFHLGRRLADQRILILGAYRPDEIALEREGEPHPLARIIHELQRDFGDIFLDLSQAEGREFLNALLDNEPNRFGSFFRQTLYRQTGGHPLFTIELLRGMQERGDLYRDKAGVWEMQSSLNWNKMPARLEGAIGERIHRLPRTLQELLQAASVEGEEFTAEVIASVLNLDEQEVVRRLSRDLDKTHALVRALGTGRAGKRRLSRYRFRHILIQLYLYNSLDEVERAYQHEAIGNTLEALYGDQAAIVAVQLARHFEMAELPDKAARYLYLAGDQARRSAALTEAIRYYQAALRYWPIEEKAGRAEVLRKLGECQWMTGHAQDALATFESGYTLFEALDNTEAAGGMQRLIGRVYWELGDREQSLHHYYQALSILEQGPESIELAWTISSISQMHMLAGEYHEAIAWGERALTQAGRIKADAVTVHALNNVGSSCLNSGDPERGRAMLEESASRALELGLPHDACRARLNLGEGLASLDYYEEARATFAELHAYAARVHASLYAGSSLAELAQLDWMAGRWQAALNYRPQILEWLERGQSLAYVEVIASILFGWQHNNLGQPAAAYEILTKTLPKVRGFDELQMTAPHQGQLAQALAGQGLNQEAKRVARELLVAIQRSAYDSRFSTFPLLMIIHQLAEPVEPDLNHEITITLHGLEQANTRIGSQATAAALYEGRGIISLKQNAPRQAIESLGQAANLWQSLGRPYDRARALNSLGQALLRAGENEQRAVTLGQASQLIKFLAAQLEETELRNSFLNSALVQAIDTALTQGPHT